MHLEPEAGERGRGGTQEQALAARCICSWYKTINIRHLRLLRDSSSQTTARPAPPFENRNIRQSSYGGM